MSSRKQSSAKVRKLSAAEQRAARSERIQVAEAEPSGWVARSESVGERAYYLFCNPKTERLVCTCADFVYRGKSEPGYECKHVSAVLKFIGRWYLSHGYRPHIRTSSVA